MTACRFAVLASLVMPALLAPPATAQTDPIAWHSSLEAAKAEARQSGKLVLVHFWTEDCAPCVALERNVFSQPEVANALRLQFVPVKLNANANPATASQMGVTRVPTDVIITPDGQMAGRLISPATPMAYVSELTQVAARFQGQSGLAMDGAIAAATQPSQIPVATGAPSGQQVNSVYAGLSLQNAAPQMQPQTAGVPNPYLQSSAPQTLAQSPPAMGDRYTPSQPFAAPAYNAAPNQSLPPANMAAQSPNASPAQPQFSPQAQLAQQQPATAPAAINNRYTQSTPAAASYAAPPAAVTPTAMQPSAGQPLAPQTVTNQFAPVQAPQYPVTQPQTAPANAVTAATPSANTLPDPRLLPAGAPPLGFEGYCPVSMRGEWKWVAGNPQIGAIHRGRTYWFASQTQQQQFLANPDYFSPALSGIDPVLAIEHRQQVPGKREHSIDYDNLFYMFSSEASLQQFTANPERYATSVRAAMNLQRGRAVR